ncbi:MAG: hypothetical protein FGM22_08425 [Burkholderiaceae bacterium]|nr:hypothetical protein [Burkholderiaceae bacterium]
MIPLIERARRYVAKAGPAISGAGGHTHTLLVAKALVKGFALPHAEALALLEEWNQGNAEKWTLHELEHKIRSAANGPGVDGYLLNTQDERVVSDRPPMSRPDVRKRREFDLAALEAQSAGLGDVADLVWLANRSEIDPATVTAEGFLRRLYMPDERVIVFSEYKSQGQALWPTEKIPTAGPEGIWFLAQPVDGKRHPNPRVGKMSRRSEESVTAWRWMVLESDSAPLRLWLGALVRVVTRVAAITTSGGRSVHALVRVDARTKREWDDVKRRLENLAVVGADPGALSAVRLTRLPACMRGDREQKLLYFSPSAASRPMTVAEMLPRRDVLRLWRERTVALAAAGYPEDEVQACAKGCRFYAKYDNWLKSAAEELEGIKKS